VERGKFYVLPKLPYDYKDLESYYIDYKNARAKFVDAFWNIVNWDEENKRLEELSKYHVSAFMFCGDLMQGRPRTRPRKTILMEVKRMVLRNVVKVDEEKPLFQLFFLKENEDRSVEVEEVEEIDFEEVKKRLEQGESVFITRKRKQKLITHKRKQKLNMTLVAREDAAELWYFSRI